MRLDSTFEFHLQKINKLSKCLFFVENSQDRIADFEMKENSIELENSRKTTW